MTHSVLPLLYWCIASKQNQLLELSVLQPNEDHVSLLCMFMHLLVEHVMQTMWGLIKKSNLVRNSSGFLVLYCVDVLHSGLYLAEVGIKMGMCQRNAK